MTLKKALALAKLGIHVFPVLLTDDGKKIPRTPAGHLDATTDEHDIEHWFGTEFRDSAVGVHTGKSGLVILDIDIKNGIDGFDSLGLYDVPDTVNYETPSGGYHFVYAAPKGVNLNGSANYLKMQNVDRRGGSSYAVWYGDAPTSREEISDAPDWLCEPARVRSAEAFEGDVEEWFQSLTPGEPSAAVRRSISEVSYDLSHSEMVSAQYHAIRLGAEGHPGVPEYLEALEEAWLNRPSENHGTPEGDWEYKFAEALQTGIEQYGDLISELKDMETVTVGEIPPSVPSHLLFGAGESTKSEWTQALSALMDAGFSDQEIVRILWTAPKTRPLSMDWGIDFVKTTRVADARVRHLAPETDSYPSIEELRDEGVETPEVKLLTDAERARAEMQYTFADMYLRTGEASGFANPVMFRGAAWTVLSMAFGFKGFITPGATDTMPLNLWFVTLAYSGTGKTRAAKFQEQIMNLVHDQDNLEQPHTIGGNLSPQSLHIALLERNRQPLILFEDEAVGFIKRIGGEKWMESMPQDMAHFYEGGVGTISKVSQSHLKGKSGRTSFNVHLYSTPENFFDLVEEEQFASGFWARFNWIIPEKPVYTPNSIDLGESRDRPEALMTLPPLVAELGAFLKTARDELPSGTPVHSSKAALARQEEAANYVFEMIQGHAKYTILEPAVRRVAYDTIRKTSVLTALSTGYREVQEIHVLVALASLEEWVQNLLVVSEKVDRSLFYRKSLEIVSYVMSRKGSVSTDTAIYKTFAGDVQRGPRELQDRIDLMVRAGYLVPETSSAGVLRYRGNL